MEPTSIDIDLSVNKVVWVSLSATKQLMNSPLEDGGSQQMFHQTELC